MPNTKKKSKGNIFLNWLLGTDKIKDGEKIKFTEQDNTSLIRKIKNSGVKLNNKKLKEELKCKNYINNEVYPYISSHQKLINELMKQINLLVSKKTQKKWLGGKMFKFTKEDKENLEDYNRIMKEIQSKKYDVYQMKALKLCGDLGFESFMTQFNSILEKIQQKYFDSPMSNVDEERQLMFHETICMMRRIEKGEKNYEKMEAKCSTETNDLKDIKNLFDRIESNNNSNKKVSIKKISNKNNRNKSVRNKNKSLKNKKTSKSLFDSNASTIFNQYKTPTESLKKRNPNRKILDKESKDSEQFQSIIDSTLESFKSLDENESL